MKLHGKSFKLTKKPLIMHLQSAPGLCGIAVIRSVLKAQFRIKTEENELIEIVADFYSQKEYVHNIIKSKSIQLSSQKPQRDGSYGDAASVTFTDGISKMLCTYQKKQLNSSPKETVQKLGTSPAAMTYCLKKKINFPVKIFCSKQGNVNELQTLHQEKNIVPIIHRSVRPPEFGLTKPEGHYVIFCGVDNNKVKIFDPKVGAREYTIKGFEKVWQNRDEKWFLVAVPKEIELNLKGRYL